MKLLIAISLALATTLAGCVVAPVGPGPYYDGPGAYYGGAVVGPPIVIEGYYGHGGYYHHHHWR